MQTAAQYLQRRVTDVLLEHGVSINAGSPIIRAIQYENISIVMYMLHQGANYNRHIHSNCLMQLDLGAHKSLKDFKKTETMLVIFYLVAKHRGKPRYSLRGGPDRPASFVKVIEDSEFWSGKVEAILGKEILSQ